MALTKPKLNIPWPIYKAIGKVKRRFQKKEPPFPDFYKLPAYKDSPKKRPGNFKRMPFEVPKDEGRYEGRFDTKKIINRRSNMESKHKIKPESSQAESASKTLQDSLRDWYGTMGKKVKKYLLGKNRSENTGQAHRNRLFKDID